MSSSKPIASTLLALAIYQTVAILLFGLPVLHDFSHTYIGIKRSTDQSGYMWLLSWWPFAISNRLNPFLTKLVWAPPGFNVTWAHCVPLPALLAAPITRAWGPIVSWNILCLIAPALAAACAFILCDHLCGSFVPSLIGGYLFGFSPYMLGHLLGHLSLIEVFPVPLAVYLIALRLEGRLSRRLFVALFAAAALVQFLCCHEVLATTVLLGAIVALAAMLIFKPPARQLLAETCALTAIGLAAASMLVLPFLYYALFDGFPHGPINPPQAYSSDLIAFFVPTSLLLAGQPAAIASIAARISGGFAEDTAYVGIPMLLLVVDYGLNNCDKPLVRLMVLALIIIALASMGPTLHVAGTQRFALPWAVFTRLPIINQALPGRFMMFAFLDLALITACYLSTAPHPMRKWILAALSVASIVPNLSAGWWFSKADTPRFFSAGSFRHELQKDEITLVLPYGSEGNSMLWQAQTTMYFRMAGGFLGRIPPEFQRWPIMSSLYSGEPSFDFAQQFNFFLAAHDVKTIIVAADARQRWPALLAPLHLTGRTVDDVLLYRVPSDLRAAYAAITVHEAATSAATDAFEAMVTAANGYWAKGLPLAKLTPWEAARLGLLALPPSSAGPVPEAPQWWRNVWLGTLGGSTVSVGVTGQYQDLAPVIERFGPAAKEIFFPFPERLQAPTAADRDGQLLMTFDREGLARAAAEAAMAQPQHRRIKEN